MGKQGKIKIPGEWLKHNYVISFDYVNKQIPK
jgi:hypothetical protein